MRHRSTLTFVILIVAVTGSVAWAGGTAADSSFAISATPAVDTPDRDVSFRDQTFTVKAIARVDPGDVVSASVSAPSDAKIDLLLYNRNGGIVDWDELTGSGSRQVPTSANGTPYSPGTYTFVVQYYGENKAVHPVVIKGYDVSVDAPSSVIEGGSVTVEASVSTVDGEKPIDRVQVVIGDSGNERRITMTDQGDGQYEAAFTADTLPTGDYSLYVVVQGSEEVLDRQEILGISDTQSFTISEPTPTPTATESSSNDGGGGSSGGTGGGSGGGGATTSTPTDTETVSPTTSTPTPPTVTDTPSPTTTAPPTTSTPTAVTTTEPPTTVSSNPSTDPPTTATTSPSNVITPRPTTSVSGSTVEVTQTPGQPLGFLPPLAALLTFSLLWHRRT